MTLKDKIKNLSLGAKAGLAGLGLATIVGTFGGNEGGLAPFYNKKVGTWGGINVGGYTEFQENSKFYGLSVSLFQLQNEKNNFYANNDFYGAQIGLLNASKNLNGSQIGIFNFSGDLNGAQVGVILNASNKLKGAQIGIGNENQKGWSVLLGFGNAEGETK